MSTHDALSSQDGLTGRRKTQALLTLGLGITITIMDGIIAAVSLPSIASSLSIDASLSVWIVNAYQLVIVMALLPLAAVGEIIGYRRIYLAGLVLFVFAAILSSLSSGLVMLALARSLQGIAAACVMCVNLALLRYCVPKAQFGRAIGVNATIAALATTISPAVSSAVLSIASWHWLFAIGAPFALLTLVLGWKSLPESDRRNSPTDWISALLSAGTFGAFSLTAINFSHGETVSFVLAPLAMAIVCGTLLIRRLRDDPAPLLPLDLLRIPIFRLSLLTSLGSFGSQMLAFIGIPFFFQQSLGYAVADSGLFLSPWPLALAFTAGLASKLADKHHPATLGIIGMLTLAAGLLILSGASANSSMMLVIVSVAICGFGFGLFQPANNRAIIGAAPQHRSGAASGTLATARLLGQSLGAAAAAYLLSAPGQDGALYCLYGSAIFALCAAACSALRLNTPYVYK